MPLNTDTTHDAEKFRTAFLRTLSGSQRVQMAVDLTEDAHSICRQGIAARHPDYSPEEIELAFVRLLLGDELFTAARPTARLLAP